MAADRLINPSRGVYFCPVTKAGDPVCAPPPPSFFLVADNVWHENVNFVLHRILKKVAAQETEQTCFKSLERLKGVGLLAVNWLEK